jgi:RNA polymerase sigma-70 factor (ECF subfamily)
LELCRAAAAGDHKAFHALVDRHGSSLFRVALSLSQSRCDAEDICQETFIAAFRGLAGFDGRASVKTWLTRILMRRAATAWKKRRYDRRSISLQGRGAADVDGRGDGGGLASERLSVESATGEVDQRLDLLQAIGALPADFREAVVLREIDGMTYQEIAQTLGVPVGTVESRLHRGRMELRRKLSGYATAGCDRPPLLTAADCRSGGHE